MRAPNGWISHGFYIWNELDRRGFVSKGFVLEIPDLRHGSERALDGFYQSVRQFFHTLEESTRAQLRRSADSDYREELLSYKRITDERCEPDSWAAITRNERFNRYWQAMHLGRLRRERLVLFLSKRITADPPASTDKRLLADHYRRVPLQTECPVDHIIGRCRERCVQVEHHSQRVHDRHQPLAVTLDDRRVLFSGSSNVRGAGRTIKRGSFARTGAF
jgi:hypothetical protein